MMKVGALCSDMSLFLSTFFQLVLALNFCNLCSSSSNHQQISDRNLNNVNGGVSCPLNFVAFNELLKEVRPRHINLPSQCHVPERIRFLLSEYLHTSDHFVLPPATVQPCWASYKDFVRKYLPGFDVEATCGYQPQWFSGSCLNITTRKQFESQFPESGLDEMRLHCNQSLDIGSACESCTSKLLSLGKLYLQQGPAGTQNGSDCTGFLFMYAAAFVNQLGPNDPAVARCFFRMEYSLRAITVRHHRPVISGAILGCIIGVLGALIAVWLLLKLHKKYEKEKMTDAGKDEASLELGLGSCRNANLVKFKLEEIRKATRNFSTDNLIGKGGYGNVYKGVLTDGSEVAFKRFKNCSASGDASFTHEVGIIASVRHVNLVALKGYCTVSRPLEGHQRIIVCDLVRNGSLHDHLFGSEMKKLSWPTRQKIALGTARGLAYLHSGVHPAIIHRDIKASNILLDETFEPKVADFGLARFNPQGRTHLSTRVAGTLGYVAPEYALYGKLTERSDVYSFGVVLLELLSGRKAYERNDQGEVSLLTDWAWSLVKEERALDVIEENMPEVGLPHVMEHYVLIALICAHPQLHARPTMDRIVNQLEIQLTTVNSNPVGVYPNLQNLAASVSDVSISVCSSSYVSTSCTSDDPNYDRLYRNN